MNHRTVIDLERDAEHVHDPLEPEFVSAFDGSVPVRDFLDSGSLFPMRNVSGLSGDGAVGKSFIATQLAIAAASVDLQWLGFEILHHGRTLYLSAEDDRDEVHIRLASICEAEGIDLHSLDETLAFLHCAGHDVVLATEEKGGRVKPTETFARLRKACEKVRPKLLILDPLANLFAVNENSRTSALACIALLRGLAIDFDMHVQLLMHPSLSGLNSGSGTSGSTSWNNAMRSRLYLTTKRGGDDEEEIDPDARYLTPKKSNYAKLGEAIPLRWQDGRFVRADEERPFDGVNVRHLEQVREAFRNGDWRYDERAGDWGGYLIAEIIDADIGRGKKVRDLTKSEKAGRERVRKIISTWMRAEQIGIVGRAGPDRHLSKFFRAG
ncbi:AAA family ATPase [Sinorhizobium sp. 8-89]|uniref:AAA family ATPase n=1 Tax=Sinorhizobium sp. 7-81 TaxID=3049087 RepID=UPI0024C3E8C1|nr:AAA family ATPase [Sinorhizobium sp. 7-81]MDK1385117.1 AAA family ATPase [Sinorhizobium sp. 7-81]